MEKTVKEFKQGSHFLGRISWWPNAIIRMKKHRDLYNRCGTWSLTWTVKQIYGLKLFLEGGSKCNGVFHWSWMWSKDWLQGRGECMCVYMSACWLAVVGVESLVRGKMKSLVCRTWDLKHLWNNPSVPISSWVYGSGFGNMTWVKDAMWEWLVEVIRVNEMGRESV